MDQTQTALTQQAVEVSQMATELIRYHAVKLGSGKPRNNCARCGDSVRRGDDHLRAHMHGTTILFHWRCFFAQMLESNQRNIKNIVALPSVIQPPVRHS